MRRSALFFLLAFAMCLNSHAQKGGWEVGGSVSLTTSWIINQNAYEVLEKLCSADPLIAGSEPGYSLTPGIGVGALAAYRSGSFWIAQAELQYSKAGQNYRESWTNNACERDLSDFRRKFTLHYLQLPLLMRFQSRNRGKVKGYGEAGVQLGMLIGAQEKITLSGQVPSDVELTPAKDKVSRIDFGVVVGGGADITVAKNIYLSAGLRTYFGFIDLNDGDAEVFVSANDNSYQKSRNFNAGIYVGVHYVFDWVGAMYR